MVNPDERSPASAWWLVGLLVFSLGIGLHYVGFIAGPRVLDERSRASVLWLAMAIFLIALQSVALARLLRADRSFVRWLIFPIVYLFIIGPVQLLGDAPWWVLLVDNLRAVVLAGLAYRTHRALAS